MFFYLSQIHKKVFENIKTIVKNLIRHLSEIDVYQFSDRFGKISIKS